MLSRSLYIGKRTYSDMNVELLKLQLRESRLSHLYFFATGVGIGLIVGQSLNNKNHLCTCLNEEFEKAKHSTA